MSSIRLFAHAEDSILIKANQYPKGDTTRLELLSKAAWGYQYIDLEKAAVMAEEGLEEATQYKWPAGIYKFLVTSATIYQTQTKYDKSIIYFKKAIAMADSLNKKKWLHTCYNNLGNTYNLLGDVQAALECYETSLAIRKKYDPSTNRSSTYVNIGTIYARLNDFETAIAKQKIALTDPLNTFADSLTIITNMTNLYAGLKQQDSSLKYLRISQGIIRQHPELSENDQLTYYSSLFEYNLKFDLKNVDPKDFETAIRFAENSKNEYNLARTFCLIASIYLAKQKPDSALHYCQLGEHIHKHQNNYVDLKHVYAMMGEIYHKLNNPEKAYMYAKRENQMSDSIFNARAAEASRIAEVRYKAKEKDEKNTLLEKEKHTEAKLKYLYLLFGLLISIAIGLYLIQKKTSSEKKLKEIFANQLLNSQEEERQRIAKDLHDSVGQNILFIKNQLQRSHKDDDQLITSIDIALEEVRTISKNLYPNQLDKYGLTTAVQALSEQVNKTTGIFVSTDMDGIDDALNKNVQINFYRIIQEFVNNTIKHADATAIRISTKLTPTDITLIVQDNGKGFNKQEIDKKSTTSSGLLNMEERIKMLKGKIDILSEPGKGTKSVFTIPI
jgi:signal transduction histidine kinase